MSVKPALRLQGEARLFGGWQRSFEHDSNVTDCTMRLAVYEPPHAGGATLLWLSGLTCTEENFTVKAGAQRTAAELGLTLVMPDTSPRGDGVADDPDGAYDLGLGAGFYLDATAEPWSAHYRMASYLKEELPGLLETELPVDRKRLSVSGHSMGGHGALTLALNAPERYQSVSAFAPICAPSECPWGVKAFTAYLGQNPIEWRAYDACALLEDGRRPPPLKVSQGSADEFLELQLKPERLKAICAAQGVPLDYESCKGYDHSYFFIASFIEPHLRWHAEHLL